MTNPNPNPERNPMPIELDKPRTPSVTVRHEKGATLVAAVINKKTVDDRDFSTGQPKRREDGSVVKKQIVTALVIDGSKAAVGNKDERRAGQAGEVVNLHLTGWDFGAWIDGTKGHAVAVGDVFKWTYERDEPSKLSPNDRKVTTFKIRRPTAEEAQQTQRCEELYHDLTASPTAGIPLDGGYADEDPF